jgi:hypothetical protein
MRKWVVKGKVISVSRFQGAFLDLPSISFRNFLQAHHGSLNSTALTAAFVFHHVAPQERHL